MMRIEEIIWILLLYILIGGCEKKDVADDAPPLPAIKTLESENIDPKLTNNPPRQLLRKETIELPDGEIGVWSISISKYDAYSPAIGIDGSIYIGAGSNLYAVKPDGSIKWFYNIHMADQGTSGAVVDNEGTIYAGDCSGILYAINPEGKKKWEFNVGRDIRSAPAIARDGTIYIGNDEGKFYALNPDGTMKWQAEVPISIQTSPAIGRDRTIYIASQKKYVKSKGECGLFALYPDGTVKWVFHFKGKYTALTNAAIGDDETIYIADCDLFAINPNGKLKWKFKSEDGAFSSPIVDPESIVYAGTYNLGYGGSPCPFYQKLYAINPDGTKKWAVSTGLIYSAPVIGRNNIIYVASSPGPGTNNEKRKNLIHAFNLSGKEKWSLQVDGEVHANPAISRDGSLYFSVQGVISGKKSIGDARLYSIDIKSGGLGISAWPMHQNNQQHTGHNK